MTVIATASNPRFWVSRVDVDRDGPTYTIDTLRDLPPQLPDADLYFITGADALSDIFTWRDADELFELAHFVGCTRPGYQMDRSTLEGIPEDRVTIVEIPALAISSTDCRERTCAGDPVWYLVPDGVVQYISKHSPLRPPPQHHQLGIQDTHVTATDRALELVRTAAQAASDKLADNIIAFDVSEQLVITDAFLLCSAPNDRQVKAIVDEVEDQLREIGAKPVRREGERDGRWVLIDYADIVVHVQHEEERVLLRPRAAVARLPADLAARHGHPGRRRPSEPDLTAARRTEEPVAGWSLLRHGRTAWNDVGRAQGHADVELDDRRARAGRGRRAVPRRAAAGRALDLRPGPGPADLPRTSSRRPAWRRSPTRGCGSSTSAPGRA